MPDNVDPQDPPAGDGGKPSTGDGSAPPAGDGNDPKDGGTSDGGESISLEEARKLRKENETLRRRAKAAEEASLTEQQRKDKELEELRAKATSWEAEKRDYRLREAVGEAARKLNFVNPTLAYRLIDRGAVNYDEDGGAPTNVDALLKDLTKSDPYLVSGTSNGGSWGAGARGSATGDGTSDAGSDMTSMIRRAAGRN